MARLPARRRFQGTIRPGGPDWVYLPVEVPAGVGELAVRYRYDRPPAPPGTAGNALDLGVLDQRSEVRGWSGGARDGFSISRSGATPGYLPGPIGHGTWQVVLGPYTVGP
ncbi:MAG TPA: phosphoesterase, partial [Actinomycetota bacterium]|nr:phosphoesterase [Actinomycetota bacterium]